MNTEQIAYMSVAEQANLIASTKLSPVDLVQLYLDRIEKYDNILHSWITVCGDQALAECLDLLDHREPLGVAAC